MLDQWFVNLKLCGSHLKFEIGTGVNITVIEIDTGVDITMIEIDTGVDITMIEIDTGGDITIINQKTCKNLQNRLPLRLAEGRFRNLGSTLLC